MGGFTLPYFEMYYRATEIKVVWSWQREGCIDQWNNLENSEIAPCKYGQVIFDKGAKAVQWQQSKVSLVLNLSPYTKINSKWIIDVNVKLKKPLNSEKKTQEKTFRT